MARVHRVTYKIMEKGSEDNHPFWKTTDAVRSAYLAKYFALNAAHMLEEYEQDHPVEASNYYLNKAEEYQAKAQAKEALDHEV